MKKKCAGCGLLKKLKFFSKYSHGSPVRRRNCIDCRNSWRRVYRKTKRGHLASLAYYSANRDHCSLNHKRYYVKNKNAIIKYTNTYIRSRDFGLMYKYYSMQRRCKNPSQYNYRYYGGRGIKNLWKSYRDFKNDMYLLYIEHLNVHGKKQTTLDRIDVNGHYCKENCRWATWSEQGKNKRPRPKICYN